MEEVGKPDVVIVGAGLGGLALAYYLQNSFNVTILEASDRIGGVVSSKSKDGFLLEYGPNTTRTTPELEELIVSLGIETEVISASTSSKKRYLVTKTSSSETEIVAAPSGLLEAITSPLLTMTEKLRALKEPFVSRSESSNESVDEFITRRFGKGVSQKLVAAILSGIWAGDTSQMEAKSALAKLVELETEHGSVIKGLLKNKSKKAKARIISFNEGMKTLPEAIAAKLNQCRIITNAAVQKIELNAEGAKVFYNDKILHAKKTILTQPAYATAALIKPHDQDLAKQIATIPYSPLGIIHLGFKYKKINRPLDGFGFLVPPIYGDGLAGCVFNSTMFHNRAPQDYAMLTAFVGGATFPQHANVNTEENALRCIKTIKRLLSIDAEPDFVETSFLEKAIPNFNIGHHDIISAVERFCDNTQSIEILANWQKGISVADRISAAKILAEKMN